MSAIVGKGIISAGGGGELNVFVQETQPTAQNGLWVKKAKSAVTGVLIDNQVKAADGNNLTLPGNWKDQGITGPAASNLDASIVINGVIYTVICTLKDGFLLYDIETGMFSKQSGISSGAGVTEVPFVSYTKENKLYFLSSTGRYAYEADIINKKTRQLLSYGYGLPEIPFGLLIDESDGYIAITGANSNVSLHKFTLPPEGSAATTSMTMLMSLAASKKFTTAGPGAIYRNGDIFYVIQGNVVIAKYDSTTGISTLLATSVGTIDSAFQPAMNYMKVDSSILFIGLISSGNPLPAKNVGIYDIETDTATVKTDVLSDELTRRTGGKTRAVTTDETSNYIVGGYYGDATQTETQTVMKYTAKSNDLPTGTVWAHESTSENVTEMYKDKTMTLNLGIDKVLIQEADGLKVQPAAIIKNGVVTNIGGGVTPEPTPTLEGTWVLNERLYPSQNGSSIYEVISYQGVTPLGNFTGYAIGVGATSTSVLSFYLNASTIYTDYSFSNNSWNVSKPSPVQTITFPAGATASNDFITWLAANATKQ